MFLLDVDQFAEQTDFDLFDPKLDFNNIKLPSSFLHFWTLFILTAYPYFPLTLLVGRVLHAVGPVAQVGDQGVSAAARRVADQRLDVVAAVLSQSASVHGEVGGGLAENTCKRETNRLSPDEILTLSLLKAAGFSRPLPSTPGPNT